MSQYQRQGHGLWRCADLLQQSEFKIHRECQKGGANRWVSGRNGRSEAIVERGAFQQIFVV